MTNIEDMLKEVIAEAMQSITPEQEDRLIGIVEQTLKDGQDQQEEYAEVLTKLKGRKKARNKLKARIQ